MKTKILICGSTGFLMANFIRYVLYRSKDFEIISVDNLYNPNDTKRIYFNRNHRFYIGDFSNKVFMSKLINFEKPDFIICGDEIFEYETLLKITSLCEFSIPFIFIPPMIDSNDKDQICIPIKNMIKRTGNTIIELPNRFGMRQKPYSFRIFGSNIAFMMWAYLVKGNGISVSNLDIPWVYAEDVASFIWYVLENRRTGLIRMPPLGYISEKTIMEKVRLISAADFQIIENSVGDFDLLIKKYDFDNLDWIPDSKNLESVLDKTINWFNANKWALSVE